MTVEMSRAAELPFVASAPLAQSISDDECLERLAQIINDGKQDRLQEAAALIARLAVVIE
jgi:hypothetical protein